MTDSYNLDIQNSAYRDIRRINRKYIPRIFEAIKALSDEPYPHQCKKLAGSSSSYRVRVGQYRIIYEIDKERKTISVFHIRHRQQAYKG